MRYDQPKMPLVDKRDRKKHINGMKYRVACIDNVMFSAMLGSRIRDHITYYYANTPGEARVQLDKLCLTGKYRSPVDEIKTDIDFTSKALGIVILEYWSDIMGCWDLYDEELNPILAPNGPPRY